jgi:hypothetical protein
MSDRTLSLRALPALVLLAAATAVLPAAASAEVTPLPASDYAVEAACSHVSAGHAGCMALELVPLTAAAKAHTHPLGVVRSAPAVVPSPAAGSFGLRPSDVHNAYQLPDTAASAQTVAIVDAFNDPNVESDLQTYSTEFGLPSCTSANGCLSVVNESGAASPLPYPKTLSELESGLAGSGSERARAEDAAGWGLEISLDIDAVHGTCQSCHIELIEARNSSVEDLENAELTAVDSGAQEVTNSWGGAELGEAPSLEASSPFNHPGTVITASAGDDGYLSWDAEAGEQGYANFPASSPHVVSVGGTRLSLGAGSSWSNETVWNGSGAGGGGCSVVFTAQPWQQAVPDWSSVGCGSKRAVADVSADADPYTGLAVHDTSPICKFSYKEGGVEHTLYWCTIGGTSLASPMVSAVFALAGGSGGIAYPAHTLYENAASGHGLLHDVRSGSNGACSQPYVEATGLSGCTIAEEGASCSSHLICVAGVGYDGPSGLGTPDGIEAFQPQHGPTGGETETGIPGATTESEGTAPAPSPRAPVTSVPPTKTSAPASPQLSGAALTVGALVALNHRRPKVSALSFAFASNVLVNVRVTFARLVRKRSHHHIRSVWQTIGHVVTIVAYPGRNDFRLVGGFVLGHGVYHLQLAPAGGAVATIPFQIG